MAEERPKDLTATPSPGATAGPKDAPSTPDTPAVGKPTAAPVSTGKQPAEKKEPEGDFIVMGSVGGKFRLDAPVHTFGTSGTVKLNGRQLETTEWSTQRIVGLLPSDAQSGEITVDTGSGGVKKARFEV